MHLIDEENARNELGHALVNVLVHNLQRSSRLRRTGEGMGWVGVVANIKKQGKKDEKRTRQNTHPPTHKHTQTHNYPHTQTHGPC